MISDGLYAIFQPQPHGTFRDIIATLSVLGQRPLKIPVWKNTLFEGCSFKRVDTPDLCQWVNKPSFPIMYNKYFTLVLPDVAADG
jgi:hypothetical protein